MCALKVDVKHDYDFLILYQYNCTSRLRNIPPLPLALFLHFLTRQQRDKIETIKAIIEPNTAVETISRKYIKFIVILRFK